METRAPTPQQQPMKKTEKNTQFTTKARYQVARLTKIYKSCIKKNHKTLVKDLNKQRRTMFLEGKTQYHSKAKYPQINL